MFIFDVIIDKTGLSSTVLLAIFYLFHLFFCDLKSICLLFAGVLFMLLLFSLTLAYYLCLLNILLDTLNTVHFQIILFDFTSCVKVKVPQLYLTLRPHGLCSPQNSPGQNTGVGSLSLLQGIFPTQGSNPGLPHCRQIPYQLATRETQEYWSG